MFPCVPLSARKLRFEPQNITQIFPETPFIAMCTLQSVDVELYAH